MQSRFLFMHIEGAFMAHAGQKCGWELQTIGHLTIFLGLLEEFGCICHVTGSDTMLTTDMSIAEISSQIGFSSFSYFGQMFKKQQQMTPSEYRRCYLQQ